MNWIKKNKEILFLIFYCCAFFAIYSYFNLLVFDVDTHGSTQIRTQINTDINHVKFSSPDETGNYFWIKQLAQGEPLYYFEELNGVGTNLIHLRGMNTIEGKITPGSFLGMTFIYSWLAKIFGLGIVPFLTPLFAILGILFFYLLIKKLFDNKPIALISTALLSFLPGWLYYSARGMYHNVLFVSLLIIGIYLLLRCFSPCHPDPAQAGEACLREAEASLRRRQGSLANARSRIRERFFSASASWRTADQNDKNMNYFLYFLSGLFIGLAIITRTAEVVWVSLTVLLIFIFNFRKIYWPGFILFLAGLWLPFLALLYYNQILYGSLISAGYRAIMIEGGIGEAISSGILFQILITPFGFNLKSILINGYNYLFEFLPYWSVPALIGGFLFIILPKFIIKISCKKRIIYIIYLLLVTGYLLLFYGSWQFSDRIDEQTLSLGTSYLRYWLPIYILGLPFIATLIWQITKLIILFKYKYRGVYRFIIAGMLILILLMPTFNLVFRKTDESLFLLRNLNETRVKSELINHIVDEDDVIVIYKQADKIFFPERQKIITDLVVPADYRALANLAKLRNIYYYTFAKPETVAFVSQRYFEPYGIQIIDGQRVLGNDWIYKIVESP